jgi:hypothetical protein
VTPDESPRTPTPPERRPYRKTPPATPAVQAWLDGEETRDHLTQPGEAENVELWDKLNSEAEQLRRRSTPIHVQQKILSSLPDAPSKATTGPKPAVSLSTTAAMLAGVVILIAGAILGALFF